MSRSNEIKLSIIIPVYNTVKYIGYCLECIKCQTYSNIDVIIVDDGSSDGSDIICEEYVRRDHRFRYIRSNHLGVSHARNLGIKKSNSEYITFIDSDDYVDENLIQSYMQVIIKYQNLSKSFPLIVSGMCIEDYTKRINRSEYHIINVNEQIVDTLQIGDLVDLKLFNFVTNKVYMKSYINMFDIMFDETVHIAEDLKFNIDYLMYSEKQLVLINKPLYHYAIRKQGNLVTAFYGNSIEHVKKIYNNFLYWLNNEGIEKGNVTAVKVAYISDWISRLTTLYDDKRAGIDTKSKLLIIKHEIGSTEFQQLLEYVYKNNRFSPYKYFILRYQRCVLFLQLRRVYQFIIRR